MGENWKLLKLALENPKDWLFADSRAEAWILEVLHKVASGEGVVLGGEATAIEGKILIASGGTSGNPKYAIHTWETLSSAVISLVGEIGSGIQSCGVLPMHHVSGFMPIVRAVLSRGKFIQSDPKSLVQDPTNLCLSLVPTQLKRFLNDPKMVSKLRDFRMIFVGGAKVEESLLEESARLELPLAPCYGMTETAAMVTMLPPEEFLNGKRGCGPPLPGVEILSGEKDQILISTKSLAEGYAGMNRRISDPFETQDSGFFDENGSLQITGRLDRIIITGGENVDPVEIEDLIKELAQVEDAMVVGISDEEWGQKVIAFVQAKARGVEPIQSKLKKCLPGYKIPKEILFVQELPLDERGKVDWKMVKKLRLTSRA
jgi:O-succinylbenzoic acid--CoA ligase